MPTRLAGQTRSRDPARIAGQSASASSTLAGASRAVAALQHRRLPRPRRAMSQNPMRPARKASTAISLAALSTVGRPRRLQGVLASRRQGNRATSGRLEGQACRSRPGRGVAPGSSRRAGKPRQWAIGIFMSGTASPAVTEPSREATRPWTIDCGWTSTSSRSAAGRKGDAPRSVPALCSSGSLN